MCFETVTPIIAEERLWGTDFRFRIRVHRVLRGAEHARKNMDRDHGRDRDHMKNGGKNNSGARGKAKVKKITAKAHCNRP